MRRVALHTPSSVEVRVAQVLYGWHSIAGQVAKEITAKCHGIGSETVGRTLSRFARIGLVEAKSVGTMRHYRLKDRMYHHMMVTRFFEDLPKTDVFYRHDMPRTAPPMMIKKAV